ncbi:MAG: chemotaxis-specific protein-glutamate methyltransferase CheB [Candidatus Margulisiibacteriota bacterium]|jgi:two-component system chemotaxis response regulator CheB
MALKKIRVLIIDDSILIRKRLNDFINDFPNCEVVATARDGEEALKIIPVLKPDVITLDLEMPKIDGVTTLKYIMSEWPTPTIIVTSYTTFNGENSLKCLEYGAFDVILKPESNDYTDFKKELRRKIVIAANVKIKKLAPIFKTKIPLKYKFITDSQNIKKVVIIAASTGGPRTLSEVISKLKKPFPATLIIVQHMPPSFTTHLAARLDQLTDLTVKEAIDNEFLKNEHVFVTPGEHNLFFEYFNDSSCIVKLGKYKTKLDLIDTANKTIYALADIFKERCLGVVLTGMGCDALNGIRELKSKGGTAFAQNKSTSLIYGMPKAVIDAGLIDEVLPLDQIADKILNWVRKEPNE